ncbi:glycerate kinase, partial [Salmonella enterica subsp. enterica serovar Anatum]|nr:glycerate kinase [Salmonella enterica subsp. enterica serovar Anatum]
SAAEVAQAIEKGFREIFPDAQYVSVPVADGGEGTVEAMIAATCRIRNMLNRRRRKVRRGSNLCLSLPRRNTPRRQRPQQNMTLLR